MLMAATRSMRRLAQIAPGAVMHWLHFGRQAAAIGRQHLSHGLAACVRSPSIPGCAVLLALCLHLPGLGLPLVGHFATKQCIYASIARNWALDRALWHLPTVDEIRGDDRGYHLLEWPIPAAIVAVGWKYCGGSLDLWGRATSLGFTLIAVAAMAAYLERQHGRACAWGGSLALLCSPILMQQGHAFQTESCLLAAFALSQYALERWRGSGQVKWLCVLAASLAAMLVTKIFMIVFVPCFGLWIVCATRPRGEKLLACGLVGLALVPAACWYSFAYFAVDGVHGVDPARIYYSVRASGESHGWPHPLLRDPTFYKDLVDRLTLLVLTPVGACLAAIGLAHCAARGYVPAIALAGVLVVLLPRKFHELHYYWVGLLPLAAIVIGLGWSMLVELRLPRPALAALLCVWCLWGLRGGATPAFTTPAADRAVPTVARVFQQHALPADRVVTWHGTSPDLLYYVNRAGWVWPADEPTAEADLARYVEAGAAWLVVADREAFTATAGGTRWRSIMPVAAGSDWAIYRLPRR